MSKETVSVLLLALGCAVAVAVTVIWLQPPPADVPELTVAQQLQEENPSWPFYYCKAVADHQVLPGMTSDMADRAMTGTPVSRVNSDGTATFSYASATYLFDLPIPWAYVPGSRTLVTTDLDGLVRIVEQTDVFSDNLADILGTSEAAVYYRFGSPDRKIESAEGVTWIYEWLSRYDNDKVVTLIFVDNLVVDWERET